MTLTDLIKARDGSMSLTKLAASTFHLNLAIWVSWTTYVDGFNLAIWGMYGGFAIGHAGYDKTMAAVVQLKNKRLDNDADHPA